MIVAGLSQLNRINGWNGRIKRNYRRGKCCRVPSQRSMTQLKTECCRKKFGTSPLQTFRLLCNQPTFLKQPASKQVRQTDRQIERQRQREREKETAQLVIIIVNSSQTISHSVASQWLFGDLSKPNIVVSNSFRHLHFQFFFFSFLLLLLLEVFNE